MRMPSPLRTITLAIIGLITATAAHPCMIFRVTAKDGTQIVARTMEFGFSVKPSVIVVPRQRSFQSPAAAGTGTGFSWKTKYGYVGVNVFGHEDIIFDGLNEAGLAISALWFESDMRWQDVGPEDGAKAIANTVLGSWLLGNFTDVEEVKKELPKKKIFGAVVPEMKMSPPVHLIVYDKKGASLVMECDSGRCNLYDNKLGLMTNAPDFPWMLTYLRQFVGMSNEQLKPIDASGLKLKPTGHGSGLLGLPGDLTPPSRFVRLASILRLVDQQPDAQSTLNLAQHVVNGFDIIQGMIVDKDAAGKRTAVETTQWSSYRNLNSGEYFFRTYDNLTLRKVSLKSLDLNSATIKTLSMDGEKEAVIDLTARMK